MGPWEHIWVIKAILIKKSFEMSYANRKPFYSGLNVLTLNVPGDCGSSRPTRVEPRLHCVAIAWQVWERWVGSAAHSPLHAIAARALSAAYAIEPRPTHFACVRALGVPRTHSAARALWVGTRILQPAHLAAHALMSCSVKFSTHSICDPSKSRPISSKADTIF